MLYKFTHIELLIQICTHWISTHIYDIKWFSACVFEFEKKTNKQSLKNDPGTQQKLGMLYRIKHRRTLCKVCKWAAGVFTYIIS
jgi:hypothetical protein